MTNRLAISQQSAKFKAFRFLARTENIFRQPEQPTSQSLKNIRNFLFLQFDTPLGSVVHATPLYEAIKAAMPDAYISVASSQMAASVLRHNPYIDQCKVTPNPSHNFLAAVSAVRALYKKLPSGPTCIITTTGNQRPRIAIAAMLAGEAIRAGYTLALPLYHVALDFRAEQPQIENNLDILRALGHPCAALEPRIFFNDEDAAFAMRQFSEMESIPQQHGLQS